MTVALNAAHLGIFGYIPYMICCGLFLWLLRQYLFSKYHWRLLNIYYQEMIKTIQFQHQSKGWSWRRPKSVSPLVVESKEWMRSTLKILKLKTWLRRMLNTAMDCGCNCQIRKTCILENAFSFILARFIVADFLDIEPFGKIYWWSHSLYLDRYFWACITTMSFC